MNQINLEEIINDYNEYKSNVTVALDELLVLFRENKSRNGLQGILQLSEGITWMISVHNYLISNAIKSNFNEQEIIGIIEELNKALEQQDYFLVADILEYEVKEFFLNLEDIKNLN